MAVTTCARCQNQSFEIQEAKLVSSHQQFLFVQCASCGAPVGAIEALATTRRMEQDARMRKLEQQIEAIASGVHHIGRIVGGLAKQNSY